MKAFQNPAINKAGLSPAKESTDWGGWLWFNYFMAKGSYLCQCDNPIETTDRYYYESWLGKNNDSISLDDGYSSFTHQKENFSQQQAADHLIAYTNSYIEKRKTESIFYILGFPWMKSKGKSL